MWCACTTEKPPLSPTTLHPCQSTEKLYSPKPSLVPKRLGTTAVEHQHSFHRVLLMCCWSLHASIKLIHTVTSRQYIFILLKNLKLWEYKNFRQHWSKRSISSKQTFRKLQIGGSEQRLSISLFTMSIL